MKEEEEEPVIEQVFDGYHSVVLKNTTVHNSISAFTNDMFIRKAISRTLKLSESIPMSPTQMRNHRQLLTGPNFSTTVTRTAVPLRERNPAVLPNFNAGSTASITWAPLFRLKLFCLRQGLRVRMNGAARMVDSYFLDFLRDIWDNGVQRGLRFRRPVAPDNEPQRNEEQNDNNSGTHANSQSDPQAQTKNGDPPRELIVQERIIRHFPLPPPPSSTDDI
ncbi:hypothetical protein SDJN03_18407, partial [Cucurbita argyrosperma subsp. sororia]